MESFETTEILRLPISTAHVMTLNNGGVLPGVCLNINRQVEYFLDFNICLAQHRSMLRPPPALRSPRVPLLADRLGRGSPPAFSNHPSMGDQKRHVRQFV
jgi:hypothetical protein